MTIDLYKYYTNPEQLDFYNQAYEYVPHLVWQKYKGQPKELKKREDALAKDPLTAYRYAREVLKGRFEKGEEAIAKDRWLACIYARSIIKGPFPKGENAITKDSDTAFLYARDILKGRFKKGEDAILNSEYADDYRKVLKRKGIEI